MSRLARRCPPTADHLLDRLEQTLYLPGDYLLLRQVRTATGVPDALRVADAIAVETASSRGELHLHVLEVKRTAEDYARECADARKRAPFEDVCASWSFVVPAPARDVVRAISVPMGCGLIEVGTGEPVIVVAPREHKPGPVPPELLRALFRRAGGQCGTTVSREFEQGFVEELDGGRWRLTCDHTPKLPLFKTLPASVACPDCVAGRPTDHEAILARIDEAPLEVLGALRDRIDARLGLSIRSEVRDELGVDICAACHVRECQRVPLPVGGCPSCGAGATRPSQRPGPASCQPTTEAPRAAEVA